MKNIKVSVIIPVYNADKYLRKMLNSVFDQTLSDIEVIIVNDGSTDNSDNIIKEFEKKYPNLIYIKQKNQGVSVARNTALNKIRGKYTLFLDSDDFIENNMLELLYVNAEENLSDITICGYNIIQDDVKKIIKKTYMIDDNKCYSNKEIMNMVLNGDIVCFLWNKLLITENIKKYNLSFEVNRFSQDWFPVFKQISYARRISFVNIPLYNYKIRSNSNSHKINIKTIEDHNWAIKEIVGYIKNNSVDVKSNILTSFIIEHEVASIKSCCKLNSKFKFEYYKKFKISHLNFNSVVFNNEISFKIKIKYILFNLKVIHYLFIYHNKLLSK